MNLQAIVKATRLSASALTRQQRHARASADATRAGDAEAMRKATLARRRAHADWCRAQAVLAANPLPGDPT